MDATRSTSPPPIDWLLFAPGSAVLLALTHMDVRAHLVDGSRSFRDALTAERPHVVLLAMPPGGPADLALLTRKRRERPGMTAVLLTGHGMDDIRREALAGGIDEALPTDTDVDSLLARFEQRRRAYADAHLTSDLPIGGDVLVDTTLPELRRGAAIVHLRPREHALLLMLARQPGRIFTRQDLLDGAWGAAHEGDPRTVDVHVRWLREKLEPDPAAPRYLLTVRGAGYRLAPVPPRAALTKR
jgi:two-component system phosphate regulon response regulator PhoB